jgi:hypothetical protein
MSMNGQSSGDFKETSARLQLFYVVTRNSIAVLTADAFTQSNPVVYPAANLKSTTLASITKAGVLGSTVAFTRPQAGNSLVGGPAVNAGPVFLTGIRPVGIFVNDALGNAYENTPGTASGRGPYISGTGSVLGATLYETAVLTGGTAGNPLSYAPGQFLYASANGLLTNTIADAYETLAGGVQTATVIGIVTASPDANTPVLVFNLRV